MITLVGVGHVFDISSKVHDVILNRHPEVVCVELDEARYYSLLHRDAAKVDEPLPYRFLAAFQERIAHQYETEVGEEMLAAVRAARKIGAKVALIDVNADLLFGRVWETMAFEEKVKLIVMLFAGFFARKKSVEKEIKKFEEDSESYIEDFGRVFPTVKKVVIDERDQHMARAIKRISQRDTNVVAVVGDGHVQAIRKILGKGDVEVIRFSDLRRDSWEKIEKGGPTSSVSFTFDVADDGDPE